MAIDPIKRTNPMEPLAEPVPAWRSAASPTEDASPFGPDYKLDESLKPRPMRMGVPFGPDSAGTTMASLPPMSPIGAGALTELSIQAMMDAPRKTG
jgi:hypothetical protein